MRISESRSSTDRGAALTVAGPASAQNYSTDARKIGMGGNGGDRLEYCVRHGEKGSPYTAIVIPLGLLQILTMGPTSSIRIATNSIPSARWRHFQSVALHLRPRRYSVGPAIRHGQFETAN